MTTTITNEQAAHKGEPQPGRQLIVSSWDEILDIQLTQFAHMPDDFDVIMEGEGGEWGGPHYRTQMRLTMGELRRMKQEQKEKQLHHLQLLKELEQLRRMKTAVR